MSTAISGGRVGTAADCGDVSLDGAGSALIGEFVERAACVRELLPAGAR